jgi:tetratricopeptide (TPR) repeat protein
VIHSKDIYEVNNLQFIPMIKFKTYREYLVEGDNYYNEKRYSKAIESYKKAIETNPKICEESYYKLGKIIMA